MGNEKNPNDTSSNEKDDMKNELDKKDKVGNINNTDDKSNDPYLENAKKIEELTGQKGLGNVKTAHSGNLDEGVNSDMLLGWHPVIVENMPSGGLFYPRDFKVNIRAAKSAEIRHWSTLDERMLYDVEDKLNHIIQNCTKVYADKRVLSWKDILEEDRIYILLAIRDLTFKEGENKLQVEKHCPDCGHKNVIEIKNKNWQYNKLPDEIYKYYDDEKRLLRIQSKNYGIIEMRPPSIGVMGEVTKYIREKQRKNEFYDQSWLQLVPYLKHEWRGFKEKDIFDGEIDFKGWDEKKYMLYYRLAEKIKVGVKPDVSCNCSECSAEVTAQVDFQSVGGIKGLFVISDISGELL